MKRKLLLTSKEGFTLIETIISLSIITAIIFSFAFVFIKNNELKEKTRKNVERELILESLHNEFMIDPEHCMEYLKQFNLHYSQDGGVSKKMVYWHYLNDYDDMMIRTYLDRYDQYYIMECRIFGRRYERWVRKKVE